jgi:outer membrane protein assembly factor BamB
MLSFAQFATLKSLFTPGASVRKQLLSLLAAFSLVAGCQSNSAAPGAAPTGSTSTVQSAPIPVGGFAEQWNAPTSAQIAHLYLRGDMVFAYTQNDKVYAFSASGGQLIWGHQMGHPGDQIQPPVVLDKDLTVIAGISTIDRIDVHGNTQPIIEIGHSIRSPLVGVGNFVFCGLDYPTGGHMAKIDLTKPVNNAVWEYVIQAGISASPALFNGIIYAGGEDGKIYAVNEQRDVIWPLPDGGIFKTDGRIVADLKADKDGVYIASTDTKLYCLDPSTGKIRWMYYGSLPLIDSPAVTADSVYQALPDHGIVALDKTSGDYNRKPRWTVENAKKFLAADDHYTYLQTYDNSIIGVDKKTGEQKFHSTRTDLVAFASNPADSLIYAATNGGEVLCIVPVTKAGTVGAVVRADEDFASVAMAK